MRPRGRTMALTVATLAVAGAAAVLALTLQAGAHANPCHGVPTVRRPEFGWLFYGGEQFTRAWVCGHFGEPRAVTRARAGVLWRYGPNGWRGLSFIRRPDGRLAVTS